MQKVAPLMLVVLGGCMGEIARPAPPAGGELPTVVVTPPEKIPEVFEPDPTVLRRLTRDEYRNTVADVLKVAPPEAADLPEDVYLNTFVTTAKLGLTPALTTRYLDAASGIATRLASTLPAVLGCTPTDTSAEAACVTSGLNAVGRRLFRRPLTADEAQHYLGLFTAARTDAPYADAVTLMFEAMLSSPQFLFLEVPSGAAGAPEKLDSFQMASRLSYLLWRTAPDEELLAAAQRGELTTPETLAPHTQRLLADPKAKRAVSGLFDDWFALDTIRLRTRLSADERNQVLADTRRVIDEQFWQQGANFKTLVSQLLMSRGVLLSMASSQESAIIYRGKYLRLRFLCGQLPRPPDTVPPLPEVMENVTSRERITQHTSGAACIGCHQYMNPLGFALEHYDVDGVYRETEHGLAIDANVRFDEPGFVAQVTSAETFARALTDSERAQSCAVEQLFTFVYDRKPGNADDETMAALQRDFAANGYDLKQLLVSLTSIDAFFTRVAPKEPTP